MPRSSRYAIATLSLGSCEIHSLESKLVAASNAGFRRLELFVADFEKYVSLYLQEKGLSSSVESRLSATRNLRAIAKNLDITFNCLQPLRDVEGNVDPVKRAKKVEEVRQYFAICNILDIDLILCCSSNDPESDGRVSVISRDLVEYADMAKQWQAQNGGALIRIGYEGLSWGTHVNTWSQAWACVNHEPRPNLGLIVDSFNSLGREYADPYNAPTGLQRSPAASIVFLRQHLNQLISTVPGNKIFLFQVADACMPPAHLSRPPPPESGTPRLLPWSRNCRLFPLEVERGAYLPVTAYARAVLATGYQGDLSLEVFNASLHEANKDVPMQHATRAYSALERLDRALDEQVDESKTERPDSPRRVRGSPRVALVPLQPASAM